MSLHVSRICRNVSQIVYNARKNVSATPSHLVEEGNINNTNEVENGLFCLKKNLSTHKLRAVLTMAQRVHGIFS